MNILRRAFVPGTLLAAGTHGLHRHLLPPRFLVTFAVPPAVLGVALYQLARRGQRLLRAGELEQRILAVDVGACAGHSVDDARAAGQTPELAGHRPLSESHILRHGLPAGSVAPAFDLPSVNGQDVRLADYAGRRVLVVFSDAHCPPCRQLAPALQQLHAQSDSGDPAILMISRGTAAENLAEAQELGLTFPIALQEGWRISREYGIFATPVGFLVDQAGRTMRPVAIGPEAVLAAWREGRHLVA